MARADGNNRDLTQRIQGNGQRPAPLVNPVKSLLDSPAVKKRFEQVLNQRAPQFMSSIVNLVNNDAYLAKAEPMSIIGSCMVAATLDLPIDKNLGYAWVIPYNSKEGPKAQFQMGYKGYIQLALRSAQYKYINVIEVYEGELISFNRLTEEFVFDQTKRTSDKVIGYAAYFELLNGFRKAVYWTVDQIIAHKQRFSKQKKEGGTWDTDFDAMAMKTVLKNMLAKWGILSIDMQKAVINDENGFTLKDTDESHSGEMFDIQPLEPEVEVPIANETAITIEPDGDSQ